MKNKTKPKHLPFKDILSPLMRREIKKAKRALEKINARKEQQSVTHEAHALINGPRRAAYGTKGESFTRIGIGWGCVLHARGLTASSAPIPGDVVALMMTWLKTVREAKCHARDNCVDGAAYFELAHEVAEEIKASVGGVK